LRPLLFFQGRLEARIFALSVATRVPRDLDARRPL